MRAIGFAFVVVAASSNVACKKPEDSASGGPKPPPPPTLKVPLAVAVEAPAPEALTLTGMIAADQRSDVTADTQGKVLNVMIERGQEVKMGQPVIQLDVRSAALGAREAQANLASARAQKELAEQECARTKSLFDKGAITKSEYDRQTTQCTAALEQVAGAQARAEMMGKSVADGLVRAPFAGTIAEKMVSPGEWVMPGKPLFTLVDDKPLRVNLSVPERAIEKIKLDQHVEIRAVSNDKRVGAKITRLGAEIGRTRALIVEATIDDNSGLKPGMFAEAHVVVGEKPAVVVPSTAIRGKGKYKRAFVVSNGELEERIVQLGVSPGEGKETVLQGIATGEKYVAQLTDAVVDGAKVQE